MVKVVARNEDMSFEMEYELGVARIDGLSMFTH